MINVPKKTLASQLQIFMRFVLDAIYHAALCLYNSKLCKLIIKFFLKNSNWKLIHTLDYTCTIQRITLAVYQNFGQN